MNIVITGTSRGIGLELTREALTRGHKVLAVARQPGDSEGLSHLKSQYPAQLLTAAVELTDPECGDKVAAAIHDWRSVDRLINNAGVYAKGEAVEDFLKSFHVNSVVPFLITKALLGKLRQGQSPKVVQITSLMGSIADNTSGGSYAYRASKAALNMINKGLAVENNWLTTVVMHPGWVKTAMGGAGAPMEASQSAHGLWAVIEGLKEKNSGHFYDFQGRELPW